MRPEQLFRKSVFGDLGFYFLNGMLPNLLLAVPLSSSAMSHTICSGALHAAVAAWPIWLRGLAAFVVGDLGFYWGHRWAHKFPCCGASMRFTTDPDHVYFLISARAHPVDFVFIRLCGLIPIFLLGLGAPDSVRSDPGARR